MHTANTRPRALHIALWAAQILLSASLAWAACMKWFAPAGKLAAMWPWTGQLPRAAVALTAVADALAALGLVLPALLHIRPRLTAYAAAGVVVLMVCAATFHILRGEAGLIGINIAFGLLALFVAWGRRK